MKITFVTPTLALHGGTLMMSRYIEYLTKQGHEITVVAPRKGTGVKLPEGVKVNDFPAIPIPYFDFFTFHKVYRQQYISCIEESDFIIPIYTPLIEPAVAAVKQKELTAKVVYFCQDSFEMVYIGPFIQRTLKSPLMKSVTHTIAVSHVIAEQFEEITDTSPSVVVNGIDTELFKANPHNSKPDRPYLLFVGRPNVPKGFPAFKKVFRDVQADIPELEAIVVAPGLEPREEKGLRYVTGGDPKLLVSLYQNAAVYLNTSLAESFGLPPLEAMACGTPVVLTDTVGTREYARHEQNCLKSPINDIPRLSSAVRAVLTDEKLRNRLVKAGLETAKQYDWRKSAIEFENVLVDLSKD